MTQRTMDIFLQIPLNGRNVSNDWVVSATCYTQILPVAQMAVTAELRQWQSSAIVIFGRSGESGPEEGAMHDLTVYGLTEFQADRLRHKLDRVDVTSVGCQQYHN